MTAELRLRPLHRIPNRRALLWDDDVLYASQGYVLWRWLQREDRWESVARYRPGLARTVSASIRPTARLLRDGFHALGLLSDGSLIAILPGTLAVLEKGAATFEPVFRIRRGTRPLALTVLPDGAIYWGEYFSNPERDEVHVYGSTDGGRSWDVVHTFPKGMIRHVHSVTYDPHRKHVWVCTGDYGDEPTIFRASLDWSSVEPVLKPSQQARTVRPLVTSEGLFYGTDTEKEQNFIYRLGLDGSLTPLCRTNGPCLWSCRVGSALFFATDVEPSEIPHDSCASLYGTSDGRTWSRLVAWRKDVWPAVFQFGNIILPSGPNGTGILAATGSAVSGEDGILHLWEVICS